MFFSRWSESTMRSMSAGFMVGAPEGSGFRVQVGESFASCLVEPVKSRRVNRDGNALVEFRCRLIMRKLDGDGLTVESDLNVMRVSQFLAGLYGSANAGVGCGDPCVFGPEAADRAVPFDLQ